MDVLGVGVFLVSSSCFSALNSYRTVNPPSYDFVGSSPTAPIRLLVRFERSLLARTISTALRRDPPNLPQNPNGGTAA